MGLPKVEIWTDGSTRPSNPGPGGWCAILQFRRQTGEVIERVLVGADRLTTNNRMELTAVCDALVELSKPVELHIHTDSQYVQKGIELWISTWKENGWRTSAKEPVKNQDLWILLDAGLEPHEVHWHWVRGHDGDENNERCDRIAGHVAETRNPKPPPQLSRRAAKEQAIVWAPHKALDAEFDARVAVDD